MDPITISKLSAATIDFIQPFLPIIATKATEEIGKKIPDTVIELWKKLHSRMSRKPAAKESLQDLVENPDNTDIQAAVRVQLIKLLQSESFATEVQELLEAAKKEVKSLSGDLITVIGSGSVARSGGVAASSGGIAVGGDVLGDIHQIGGTKKTNDKKAK